MNFNDLNQRYKAWSQCPSGRLIVLLLAFVVVFAGIPGGQIHAHALGDNYHDHDADHDHGLDAEHPALQASPDSVDPNSPPPPTDNVILHFHDAGISITSLLANTASVFQGVAPSTPQLNLAVSVPPKVALAPLFRPPIV